MNVVVFDLKGSMAHFRKYYTNSSSLTYSFPPRTVLMGIIAAIMGFERDSYYEKLDSSRLAVALKVPVRKIFQTVNYIRTKKDEDIGEICKLNRVPRTQIPVEFLMPAEGKSSLRFRVFFSHPDDELLGAFLEKLREGKTFYPLYLGITECPALAEYIGFYNEKNYEIILPGETVSVNTVVNIALVNKIDTTAELPTTLFREKIPFSFGPERTLRPPIAVAYTSDGSPFRLSLKTPTYKFYDEKVNLEENIVFLEGE